MWLENPMQIKKSTGIKRTKSDKTDAQEIALYCFRFEDKARLHKPSGKTITSLRFMFSYRERLLRCKTSLAVAAKEAYKIAGDNPAAIRIYNFTRFASARQFACYCGVVPFERTSGTSIHQGNHVSKIANIKIKTYLTQAARSAIMYDQDMKAYYARKAGEGKKDQIIINNVRNKLLQRVFAVVKKKTMFKSEYENCFTLSA